MMLSRKAVRPTQAKYLLSTGFLPVSIDYRLCPEVNIIDGPMTDVRDALAWARKQLPLQLGGKYGITVDGSRVVVVGWSTGGHLAMSTAWTTRDAGMEPPAAILSFYAPVDFESGGRPYFFSLRTLSIGDYTNAHDRIGLACPKIRANARAK